MRSAPDFQEKLIFVVIIFFYIRNYEKEIMKKIHKNRQAARKPFGALQGSIFWSAKSPRLRLSQ